MGRPQRRTDAEDCGHRESACGHRRFLVCLALRLGISAVGLCLMLSAPLKAEEKPAPPAEVKTADAPPTAITSAEAKPAEAKQAHAPAATTPAGTTYVDTKLTEPPKPPTDEEIAQIHWVEFSDDHNFVCPFARDFSRNEEFPERMADWEDFLSKFAVWAPGQVLDPTEKVLNLISACALMDIGQGQFESELPLYVYQRLRREVPDAKLKDILAYIAFHPNEGDVIVTAPELNLDIGVGEEQIRERLQVFAVKMLGRMLGKLPWDRPARP